MLFGAAPWHIRITETVVLITGISPVTYWVTVQIARPPWRMINLHVLSYLRAYSGHLTTMLVSLQLRKPRGLSQPVVLIWGHDAELLMGVVNKNREAHVKIEVKEPPAWVSDASHLPSPLHPVPTMASLRGQLPSTGSVMLSFTSLRWKLWSSVRAR